MKENILFDIDYVIINTHLLKDNYRKIISELVKVSVGDVCDREKEYVKKDSNFTDFSPEEYIDFIAKSYDVSTQSVSNAFFSENNFKDICYSEVENVLNDLNKDYCLGIFSEGLKDFQMLKLHKSGLLKYFNNETTFIFRRKLTQESLNLIPRNSFIIDDNKFVIEALVQTKLFRPIWLNRKTKEKLEDCRTIFNLSEARDVIENYSAK